MGQWEGLSHILWKIKHVPNHQPDQPAMFQADGFHLNCGSSQQDKSLTCSRMQRDATIHCQIRKFDAIHCPAVSPGHCYDELQTTSPMKPHSRWMWPLLRPQWIHDKDTSDDFRSHSRNLPKASNKLQRTNSILSYSFHILSIWVYLSDQYTINPSQRASNHSSFAMRTCAPFGPRLCSTNGYKFDLIWSTWVDSRRNKASKDNCLKTWQHNTTIYNIYSQQSSKIGRLDLTVNINKIGLTLKILAKSQVRMDCLG